MRFIDMMLALPSLLLAITLAALASRSSQCTVMIAVAVVTVPIFARLLRGSMIAQPKSDYVLAASALGRQAARRSCCGTCCRTRSPRSSCRPP